MKYRKEIDGLRAFAIIPVIFFHAGLQSFGGGFVGVDIFFVISGYLITALIISELSKNKFKISNFYLRRIRRILPALFIMILACLPFAWKLFLPSDLKEFSQSMVSIIIFLSNILFWIKSGYFDSSVELKPLIHTWSLSIEEQFYILFPIICLIIFNFSKRNIFLVLGFIALIGLLSAQFIVGKYPATAFYSLPTRGWEIVCGIFVAFILHKTNFKPFKSLLINQILSLAGFGLILFSILTFDLHTPHPSFYTLIPVIGTVLLIVFMKDDTFIFKVFANKYMVGIGLLSYSLYLWHQPIFAFTKYIYTEELSIILILLLSLISFLLAYFSYRIIETPFRDKNKVSNKLLIRSISSIAIIIFIIGIVGHKTNGFLDREPPSHLSKNFYYDLQMDQHLPDKNGNNCITDIAQFCLVNNNQNNSTLMIGDSHSGDFLNVFKRYAQQRNLNAIQLTMGGCSFSPVSFQSNNGQCGQATKLLQELIAKKVISKIIFVTNFYQHIELLDEIKAKKNLTFISNLFKNAMSKNIEVVYFSPRPTLTMNFARTAMVNKLNKINVQQEKFEDLVKSHFENSLAPLGLKIYDQRKFLLEAFCKNTSTCINGMHGDRPLYRDTSHLSGYGAKFIFKDFAEQTNLVNI